MGNVIPKFHFLVITLILFFFVPASFSETRQDSQEYRDKGYNAQRAGNLDMALNYYQRAIQLDPYFAMAYNDIGVILETKGINEGAKEAYVKAISVDPNYLSAYYNLAALCEREGDLNEAAYYWRMRINLGDWSDVWTWKAKENLEKLEAKGGVDPSDISTTGDLSRGLRSNPKRDAEYHLYRGRRYLAAGKYIAALKELNAAVLLDPRNKEIEQLLEYAQRKALIYN